MTPTVVSRPHEGGVTALSALWIKDMAQTREDTLLYRVGSLHVGLPLEALYSLALGVVELFGYIYHYVD